MSESDKLQNGAANEPQDIDEADGVGRSLVRKVFNNIAERIRNPSGQSKSESVLDSGQPPITMDDLERIAERLHAARDEDEMEKILEDEIISPNIAEPEKGDTLLHLASYSKRENPTLVEFLISRRANPLIKNKAGILPVHVAVKVDNIPALQSFVEDNEEILNIKIQKDDSNDENGESLLHYAIARLSMETIRYLIQKNPECVNDLCNYGHVQLHEASVIHLANALLEREYKTLESININSYEDKKQKKSGDLHFYDKIWADLDETRKKVEDMVDMFLEHCSKGILITDGSGSVLHKLIKFRNEKAIRTIFEKRFKDDKVFLKQFSTTKNKKNRSPIEIAVTTANDPSKVSYLFKLLLDHEADVNLALEAIIDVNNISLLKLIVEHCPKPEEISSLINYQEPMKNQTFLHSLLESTMRSEDVEEGVMYLLNNGANVMLKSQFSSKNIVLPVHVAVKMQIEPTGTGEDAKSECKTHCKAYFSALKTFGLAEIFKSLSESPEIRREFLEEHLLPAAYFADYESVNQLLTLLFSYNFNMAGQSDSDIKYNIIHKFKKEFPYEETIQVYKKNLLFWATDNTNKLMMMDIVRAEHTVHRDTNTLDEGFKCFRRLSRTAHLKYKAGEAYKELIGNDTDVFGAVFSTLFEVLFFCYTLFALDLFYDIDLIEAYRDKSRTFGSKDNTTINWSNGTFRSIGEELYSADDFQKAYIISSVLVIISSLAFLVISYYSTSIPKRMRKKDGNKYYLFFLNIFKPILFLISHPVRAFRSKSNRNEVRFRNKYKEGWSAWVSIRRVELGIEATGQLLLQLWLSGPFIKEMAGWTSAETFNHIWKGLGYMISLTHIEADFLEMMIGKFLLSSIFLCFGFTVIRLQKKSQRMADSKEAFFSYFASCLLQMFMRTIDSSILFRLSSTTCITLLSLHFIISLALKATFEFAIPSINEEIERKTTFNDDQESQTNQVVACSTDSHESESLQTRISSKRDQCCQCRQFIKWIMALFSLITCTAGSTLVYVNMDNSESAVRNPDLKNSFFPATSHFVLILIEHVILVCFIFSPQENFVKKYELQHAVTMTYVPFILWFCAAATMIIYYRFFNKAQIFQDRLGPEFHCCCDVTWKPFKVKVNKCCSPGCNPCTYDGLVCCTVTSVEHCDCCDSCPEERRSLTDKQAKREEVDSNGTNGIEMVRYSNGINGPNGREMVSYSNGINGANGPELVYHKNEINVANGPDISKERRKRDSS